MSNERIPSPDAYLCLPLPVSAYVRLCLPVSVFLSLPMPVYACLCLSSCLCLCLSLLACVYIFLSLCLFHFLSLVRCTRTRTTPISHTHSFLTIFLLLSILYTVLWLQPLVCPTILSLKIKIFFKQLYRVPN